MWERKMWIVFCVVLISVFSQMWMIAKVLSVWTGSLVLGWFDEADDQIARLPSRLRQGHLVGIADGGVTLRPRTTRDRKKVRTSLG